MLCELLPPTYDSTVVVSLAVLLLVSGSTGSTAATDAVLVTVPFLLGRTTIVTIADSPSPRSPSAQLTAVFCALQRPWFALADLNRTLRSSVAELRIRGDLLEQPSPHVPGGHVGEWRCVMGEPASVVLVVAAAVYHWLDGREPLRALADDTLRPQPAVLRPRDSSASSISPV